MMRMRKICSIRSVNLEGSHLQQGFRHGGWEERMKGGK
jgi:hypothetical protein